VGLHIPGRADGVERGQADVVIERSLVFRNGSRGLYARLDVVEESDGALTERVADFLEE
jgi:hypothetical protein